MPSDVVFPTGLIHRKVGPGAVLTEVLFAPEFARLAANRAQSATAARRNLLAFLPKLDPAELSRRRRATTAREHAFDLILPPPRANEAWRDPLTLTFHAVVWDHPNGLILARVVELGIEVIAEARANLDDVLRRETLAALRRMNLSVGLRPLAGVQNTLAFSLDWVELTVPIPTLRERAIRAETDSGEGKKSVLHQVGTQLHATQQDPAYEVDEAVSQVAEALAAKPPQSVLLVGPSGVGKTAVVRELARRRAAFHLGSTPFYRTSGARIVAGQTGFGMWEERCQELVKEAGRKRAVIHVGPLVELMEVGKSECNHTGIATFLRPAIARGELLCVAECTPEQLPLVEKQDPQLLDAFRHVTLDEPDRARGQTILAKFAADNRRREIAPAALDAIDRLHRRYATYSAYPGRPLRFLENLLRDGEPRMGITADEVFHGFTRETGLPRPLIDPAVPLDLGDTHRWFASRVVGQVEAVNLVVDLLATVKAGLARPNRPIASLLFIGPTGVGKTEMAKALAEFLFGSKDRLTRFDMSEFADPVAVRRLVGGAFGSEGLLTAKVREQPFSVLLLDEVEKADASFFDLLLQALGEARMTDAGGRLADFRNTVVILTSNLGAESYRKGAAGFASGGPGAAEARAHFAQAVEQFLRPEMVNRLDRVVPFAPLAAGTVRAIADREWGKVLARDGIRFRGVNVTSAPALLDHLALAGFDPRYGARPLKRAMERELLAPLARQMNRHSGDTPLSVSVGLEGGTPAVAVKPVQGPRSQAAREVTGPAGQLAAETQVLRRWHQLVETSSVVRELNNEVYQLALREAWLLKKQARMKKLSAEDQQVLARLGRLREVADEVRLQREASFALEDAAVLAFHEATGPNPAMTDQLAAANRDWDKLLLRLYSLNASQSDSVLLALFSEHRGHLKEMALGYHAVATAHGFSVQVVGFHLPSDDPSAAPQPKREPVSTNSTPPTEPPDTAELQRPKSAWLHERLYFLGTTPPKELLYRTPHTHRADDIRVWTNTIGVAIVITGPGAHVRFWGEAGLHQIFGADDGDMANPDVFVAVGTDALLLYRPPDKMTRRGAFKNEATCRVYDFAKEQMADPHLGRVWSGMRGVFADWLEPAVAANMRARLVRLVTE